MIILLTSAKKKKDFETNDHFPQAVCRKISRICRLLLQGKIFLCIIEIEIFELALCAF